MRLGLGWPESRSGLYNLLIGLYFVGPRWELPNWCEGAQAQDDGGVSRF